MASDASTAFLLLTCERVLPHESMCVAGEARTRAVCVPSAFCTRVLVCDAQRSERGRGGGEDDGRRSVRRRAFGNREIGRSGNRETGNRELVSSRRVRKSGTWCSLCDAAAAECQLRRVIDTLAGLPSAIDTLTGASFSRTRTAAIYSTKLWRC